MKKENRYSYSRLIIGGESNGRKIDIFVSPAKESVKFAGIASLIGAGCVLTFVALGYIFGRKSLKSGNNTK